MIQDGPVELSAQPASVDDTIQRVTRVFRRMASMRAVCIPLSMASEAFRMRMFCNHSEMLGAANIIINASSVTTIMSSSKVKP